MKKTGQPQTGRAVYLALYLFVERIIYQRRGVLMPLVLPTTYPASLCAFLASVPEQPDAQQPSTAYTAAAVACRVVELGIHEGICFRGEGGRLGIYLDKPISPALARLLMQLGDSVAAACETEGMPSALLARLGVRWWPSLSALTRRLTVTIL